MARLGAKGHQGKRQGASGPTPLTLRPFPGALLKNGIFGSSTLRTPFRKLVASGARYSSAVRRKWIRVVLFVFGVCGHRHTVRMMRRRLAGRPRGGCRRVPRIRRPKLV